MATQTSKAGRFTAAGKAIARKVKPRKAADVSPMTESSGKAAVMLAIAWAQVLMVALGRTMADTITERIGKGGKVDAAALAKAGAILCGGAWVGRIPAEMGIADKSASVGVARALAICDAMQSRKAEALAKAEALRKGLAYGSGGDASKRNQNDRNLDAFKEFVNADGYARLAAAIRALGVTPGGALKNDTFTVSVPGYGKRPQQAAALLNDLFGKRVTASMIARRGTIAK